MVVEHRLEDPTEMSQNAADFATFDAFPESLSKELAHVEGGDDAAQVSKDSQLANGVHVAQPEGSTISHEAGISSQDEKLPDDVQDAHVIKTPVDEKTGRKSYQSVPGSVSGKSRDNRYISTNNASYKERSPTRTSIVGDVLQSIAAGDDEGRSRHRILAFAAKRYASAVEKNPQDSDALYNWALVLQESADSLENEAGPAEKDALLDEACKKYEAATKFCPTLHEAYYNWGIAISDRAKIRGRTKEAEELWKQACQKYDRSVQLNWTSPQALNNWGLALQELGAIVPLKEKRAIVKTAIRKFRAAIRLRFDFHRAVYNLGTVLYGLAEDTLRSGRRSSTQEGSSSDLYSSSAVYIAAAHSLKPDYPVYRSALRLVRSMLPLPYLKVGYLTVPPNGNSLAPHSNWKRLWFVLDHEALYQTEKLDQKWPASSPASESGTSAGSSQSRVEVQDISCVSPTADLSLPPGGAFVVDTPAGQHFMVADNWDAVDSWVDAIRLVYTIFVRGRTDALASVLSG